MAEFLSFSGWVISIVYVLRLQSSHLMVGNLGCFSILAIGNSCCSEHWCAALFFETRGICLCRLPKGVLDFTAIWLDILHSLSGIIQRSCFCDHSASRTQFCVLFQLYRCQYLPPFVNDQAITWCWNKFFNHTEILNGHLNILFKKQGFFLLGTGYIW